MSKNSLIIFISIITLVLAILTLLFLSGLKKQTTIPTTTYPTPTSVPVSTQPTSDKNLSDSISVTGTFPTDNSINIPLETTITINFNKQPSINDIKVFVTPSLNYSSSITGSSIIITPKTPLLAGTKYVILVEYKPNTYLSKTFDFSFITIGPTPTEIPTPTEKSAIDAENDYYKQHSPDVFLKNQTPFSNNDFTIISPGYKTTPVFHYYFTVTLKGDKDTSKASFINWLKSLGLTDQQIQGLDITYQ